MARRKDRYTGITESLTDLIGYTPLLKLNKVTKGAAGSVLVKLEHMNPSGSIKDRMALRIIEEAEASGRIQPGISKLVESSSGNTAQGIAFVGAVKGYKVKIRLPESTAMPEKKKALERFGAEIDLMRFGEAVDPEADKMAKDAGLHGATIEIPGRVKCLKEEEDDPKVYWTRQFSNPANWQAQGDIGREILEQTDGKIDVFIASIGTGGTFLGVSRVLKEALPNVKCIALQPTGWEGFEDPLSPETKYVPGITGGIVQAIRDSGIADEILFLGNEEALEMGYRLSREEGLNCGFSSAACIHVALKEAAKPGMKGKNVVTIVVDGGYRYINDERFIT